MRATVDDEGGVVIPHEILEKAGLHPDMDVELSLVDGVVVIEPVSQSDTNGWQD